LNRAARSGENLIEAKHEGVTQAASTHANWWASPDRRTDINDDNAIGTPIYSFPCGREARCVSSILSDDGVVCMAIEPGGVGYEHAMIEFIRRWHRFGGGAARDIFAEFGLAEDEFFRRTIELLDTRPFAGINEETGEYIRKVCRWRLSVVRC